MPSLAPFAGPLIPLPPRARLLQVFVQQKVMEVSGMDAQLVVQVGAPAAPAASTSARSPSC